MHREVFEEVGLKISGLSYFSSQSWPFPDSLMVAFFAWYLSGEINIDENEIADAKWFDINNLPKTPPSASIASKLIEQSVLRFG